MLDKDYQIAHVERSIRYLEDRVSADVSEIRKELSALRTAQWRAESRAERLVLTAGLAALVGTAIFAIIVMAALR